MLVLAITPSWQDPKRIEDDARHLIERSPGLEDAAWTTRGERAIRDHDPCISSATHFLRGEVRRGP